MGIRYLLRSGLGLPDYWHPRLELQSDFLCGNLGRYPISMDVKAEYPGRLNEECVPVIYVGPHPSVSPVTVSLYGLGSHDAFLNTGDKRFNQQMMYTLRWLEKHCVSLGTGIGWPNQEDIPLYGLRAPWVSAIVQGLALSLFVRASRLDSSGPWRAMAHQTWRGYHLPVEAGGFCRKIHEGVVYEEYPGTELNCVFNGMCHALIGLWEAWQSKVVSEAEEDFWRGIRTLRVLLPRFNHGTWSLYSLNQCLAKPLLASPYYQRANGLLAKVLGLISDDPEFSRQGERWLSEHESIVRRSMISLRICYDRYLGASELLHADKSKPAQPRAATPRV